LGPRVLESPSLAEGKRALKSTLRTESVASDDAKPAVGAGFDVTQPTNTIESETATHARGRSNGLHSCKLLTIQLLAVALNPSTANTHTP
jgi:hypothetical protein